MSCSRCDRLAAQIADLQLELEAWRGNARDDEARMRRLVRLSQWKADLGLTLAEAALVELLVKRKGRVVTVEALGLEASHLPGCDPDADSQLSDLVKVRMCVIRRKLSARAIAVEIETIWGVGYRLKAADAALLEARLVSDEPEPEALRRVG